MIRVWSWMKLAQPCSKPPFRLSPLLKVNALSLLHTKGKTTTTTTAYYYETVVVLLCGKTRGDIHLATHDHYISPILPSLAHSNCIHYHYTLTHTTNCTRTPRRHSTRHPLLALRPTDKERDAYIPTHCDCNPILQYNSTTALYY